MNLSKKNILITGLVITLAGTMFVGGGTLASLQSSTGDVVNEFNANQVTVELTETTGGNYEIIPGTSQTKDPTVTVDNSIDAYVFVRVNDTTDGLVTYEIESGWTLLDGYTNVYYREVTADAANKEFAVLEGNTVSYDASLENKDMLDAGGNLKEGLALTFAASAIQKDGFTTALDAWKQIPAVVSTSDELLSAISAAEQGETIKLSQSIVLNDIVHVGTGDFVLDLDGHTLEMTSFCVENPTFDQSNINLIIKNGVFQNTTAHEEYPLVSIYADENCPTNVRFENVTIIAADSDDRAVEVINGGAAVAFDNCNVTGAIYITDAQAEFNGGTYNARENDDVCIYANKGVTINAGTFTANGVSQKLFQVDGNKSDRFIINGGTFIYGAEYAIYTLGTRPASFVDINGGIFNDTAHTDLTLNDIAVLRG